MNTLRLSAVTKIKVNYFKPPNFRQSLRLDISKFRNITRNYCRIKILKQPSDRWRNFWFFGTKNKKKYFFFETFWTFHFNISLFRSDWCTNFRSHPFFEVTYFRNGLLMLKRLKNLQSRIPVWQDHLYQRWHVQLQVLFSERSRRSVLT